MSSPSPSPADPVLPQTPGSVVIADARSEYGGKTRRRVLLRRPIVEPFYPPSCWWPHQDVSDTCAFEDKHLSNVVVIFDAAGYDWQGKD